MNAIDISSYAGAPSVETFRAMTDVGLVIVAGQMSVTQNPHAEQALSNARSAGKLTATYAWLRRGRTGRQSVQGARDACGYEWEHCLFCALDCEDTGIDVPMIQEALDHAAVLQLPTKVVYTGESWWVGNIGPQHPFGQDTALWYAAYDFDPEIGLPDMGWPVAQGKQYKPYVIINGVNTNLSTFRDEWIAAIHPKVEGATMDTEKLRKALDAVWNVKTELEQAAPVIPELGERAQVLFKAVVAIKEELGLQQ